MKIPESCSSMKTAAILSPVYAENAPCYSCILKILFKIPFKNLGDLMTTIFIAASFLYLRMQPQPQAISKNATRNRRNPVGKITAISIPDPSVRAHSPSIRQFLILSPPCPLVYYHYIQRGSFGAAAVCTRKIPEALCLRDFLRYDRFDSRSSAGALTRRAGPSVHYRAGHSSGDGCGESFPPSPQPEPRSPSL